MSKRNTNFDNFEEKMQKAKDDIAKMEEKVSKRTQVLFTIFEFQKAHGRGMTFNELLELSEFDRDVVSKSLDGLSDMRLIDDTWKCVRGDYTKVIFIVEDSMAFVEKIYNEIQEGD